MCIQVFVGIRRTNCFGYQRTARSGCLLQNLFLCSSGRERRVRFEQFKLYARFGHKTSKFSPNKHLKSKHDLDPSLSIEENNRIIEQLMPIREGAHPKPRAVKQATGTADDSHLLAAEFRWTRRDKAVFSVFVPNFKLPSRGYVSSTGLWDLYTNMKTVLQRFFQEHQEIQQITLTIDLTHLTSKNDSLLAINAHFIFDEQVNTLLLKLRELEHPQTAEKLVPIFDSVLDEYFLKNRVLCFNTDEGKN